jgi:uncharacterized protein (TIGR02118 family)
MTIDMTSKEDYTFSPVLLRRSIMIRLTTLYPNKPGAKFDYSYYINKHIKTINEKFGPMGMVKIEVDKGVSGMSAGSPPSYIIITHIVFNSIDDFQKADAAHGKELGGDIPNFTDIEPQMQINEIVV